MAINRDKILQEAQKLVDKKRYDKAIAEYQKVVADDPHDVRTLLKIGDIYLRMQQFAEAIASYDRVANHYSVQGFSVKAVAVYKQMREIIQKHAPHLEDRFGHVVPKLAELLTQLDLRSDALAYYDEMATRLQTVGRDRDAIDVFRKIVSLDGNNPVSHLRLADALARVRDFDGASIEFGVAAEILMRIGRRDDALRVVERLLQYRQDAKFSRLAAQILIERNQPNDGMAALTKLQVAFKENPRDLETLGLLAKAFDLLGQTAKAVEVQKEAARIAREGGQRDIFDALLAILVQRAPNDEGVRQLVASADKPSSLPPSQMMSAPPSAYPEPAPPPPPPAPSAPQREAQQRPPPPPAPRPSSEQQEEPEEVSVVDEVSGADIIVDDEFDLEVEPASDDDAPIPLRASHPPAEDDAHGSLRTILNRADAARRAGDYPGAAEVLRRAIAELPQARELRERLCDVLIESGDQEAAVDEMLHFAAHLVEAADADAAARLLDEVLLLEPENRAALDMLRALGYAVASPDDEMPPAETAPPGPSYDPMAPLPSYDLEELTADELPIAPPDVIFPPPAAHVRPGRTQGWSRSRRRNRPAPLNHRLRARPSAGLFLLGCEGTRPRQPRPRGRARLASGTMAWFPIPRESRPATTDAGNNGQEHEPQIFRHRRHSRARQWRDHARPRPEGRAGRRRRVPARRPSPPRGDRQGYAAVRLHDRDGARLRLHLDGHGRADARPGADAGGRHADALDARRSRRHDLGLAQRL